jgi:putative sigma-54 modulation protein
MAIEITGRHIEVPAREKTRVQQRATRLERHTGKITEGRLIVTGEKRRVLAEATVTARRRNWEAHATGADLPGAITGVFEKLEAQATRERTRQKAHKGKVPARSLGRRADDAAPGESPAARAERRIVSTASVPVKPMSAEEAALELDASLHEFLVFHDSSSQRVTVLYKRKDGDFGLIAPEW